MEEYKDMTIDQRIDYVERLLKAIRIMNHNNPLSNSQKIDHFTICALLMIRSSNKFIMRNYQNFDEAIVEAVKIINTEG